MNIIKRSNCEKIFFRSLDLSHRTHVHTNVVIISFSVSQKKNHCARFWHRHVELCTSSVCAGSTTHVFSLFFTESARSSPSFGSRKIKSLLYEISDPSTYELESFHCSKNKNQWNRFVWIIMCGWKAVWWSSSLGSGRAVPIDAHRSISNSKVFRMNTSESKSRCNILSHLFSPSLNRVSLQRVY